MRWQMDGELCSYGHASRVNRYELSPQYKMKAVLYHVLGPYTDVVVSFAACLCVYAIFVAFWVLFVLNTQGSTLQLVQVLKQWVVFNAKSPLDLVGLIPRRIGSAALIRAYALYRRKSTREYVYKPLRGRNIRVIHLYPGSGRDPLRVSIVNVSLDDSSGQFETVSYAWEGAVKYCDISTDEGIVLVTPTLHCALERLRLKAEIRVLWADAVCINQHDNVEKAAQVDLMSDIYSMASRTLVYLGKAADGSDGVIQLLRRIAAARMLHDDDPMAGRWVDDALLVRSGLPPPDDPGWASLRRFWGRAWFRRVWVVQEFVCSPDVRVFCGEWEASWSILYAATRNAGLVMRVVPTIWNAFECAAMEAGISAMHAMGELRVRYMLATLRGLGLTQDSKFTSGGSYLGNAPHVLMNPETMVFEEQMQFNDARALSPGLRICGGLPLLELLSLCERSEATRARDHLFAVRGLASDATGNAFRADYSTPFKDVVRRYARAFVREGKCMDLLYESRLNVQSDRFPSWIPDWTTKYAALNPDAQYHSLGRNSKGLYSAAGDSTCWARVDDADDFLVVRGRLVDKITWIGDDDSKSGAIHGVLRRLSRAHAAISMLRVYPTGESLPEVFWRTLVANKTHNDAPVPRDFGNGLLSVYASMDAFCKALQRLPAQTTKSHLISTLGVAYYQAVMAVYPPYQLAVTENGLVGLVPQMAAVGDRIYILNGGAVPFVLMKRRSPMRGYRLVGECYMHGIMKGEALYGPGHEDDDEVFIS